MKGIILLLLTAALSIASNSSNRNSLISDHFDIPNLESRDDQFDFLNSTFKSIDDSFGDIFKDQDPDSAFNLTNMIGNVLSDMLISGLDS